MYLYGLTCFLPVGVCGFTDKEAAEEADAHLTESQKQDILSKAHNVRSEREMHDLVNSLAHGTMQ